jgi:CheY-like chemotaxis protein
MPELGGLELIAWIRANLPELPVLATSGYSDALTDERELRAQGTRFLAKPWTEESVSRLLHEIFDGDAAA